jgi:hypothetical protein
MARLSERLEMNGKRVSRVKGERYKYRKHFFDKVRAQSVLLFFVKLTIRVDENTGG